MSTQDTTSFSGASTPPENELFAKLRGHLGHRTEIAVYGDQNIAVECMTCMEVLLDADRYEGCEPIAYAGIGQAAGSEPSNAQRAAWAEAALGTFTAATTPRGSTPRTMSRFEVKDAIADLICDLLHYAETQIEMSPLTLLERGCRMFEEERAELIDTAPTAREGGAMIARTEPCASGAQIPPASVDTPTHTPSTTAYPATDVIYGWRIVDHDPMTGYVSYDVTDDDKEALDDDFGSLGEALAYRRESANAGFDTSAWVLITITTERVILDENGAESDGFRAIGPFASADEAAEHAQHSDLRDDHWDVLQMDRPNPETNTP